MRTSCVIAGGGPAGAMLALLLARAGVDVVLLEKHADFLRDFRGDTIHPSTLQALDELGLAEEFHRLPHRRAERLAFFNGSEYTPVAELSGIPGRYRYIAFVPQWDFLNLLVAHARRHPSLRVLMEAEACGLIEEDGAVRGLRYRDLSAAGGGAEHEIRAALTVGADGRESDVRREAGLRPRDFGAPMDVVWFRITRDPGDPAEPFLRIVPGGAMVAINRESYWQLAYLIPKGGFGELRERGVERFRASVAELIPFLGERVKEVTSFADTSVLVVRVDRLPLWHRPGLLCIGDAAHAMSPIGGVGINLAIQDAIAAGNLLAAPLVRAQRARGGGPVLDPVPDSLLARVQRRRQIPAAVTQLVQVTVQNRVIRPALAGTRPDALPLPARLARAPLALRRLIGLFIGLGVLPEHVNREFTVEESSQ
ncbi:2-polyprenyl-6-methoxyphenol hydroxylase-like FAD-dependent oxidoreductase [Thermocatellispora tengchongensis]|uniref:2-polyprenyl-6-methoxyphenol hydroxylase-like FAD-dependent oxidoreductase n=1 Tax=Thermocatellispora tengchongensis TaxID=1073253 RepID=A0A840NTH4_9ACTN|nr:FAD-dependent oxidoreductase [Thermocatellispora tengchongensis]MBB5132014.1 2-polyprenyl-6-methoxyphenol hydroxylase-like FAD-dependent oxidoreductase [Thermocatellispora tengchongensis]